MAETATLICWGVGIVTWIVAALYGARDSRGRRQGQSSRGLSRLALIVAAVVVSRLFWQDLRDVTDHALWIELPGLVLLVASTGFTIWARLTLGRMWSLAPNVLQEDHKLRTDGPYAITRHPIYTGLLGMLIGSVLLNGLGVTLASLLAGAIFLVIRVPIEERLMSKTFPDEYARYRERVPCLIPGLRR
jgi:protein-S-isoprenylcysteine O-methyltransferase Ste14